MDIKNIARVGQVGMVAIVSIWFVVAVLLVELAIIARSTSDAKRDEAVVASVVLPSLRHDTTPFKPEEYSERVELVNASDGVEVVAQSDGIKISARRSGDMDAWLRVLQEVPLFGEGREEWSFKSFCAGECSGTMFVSVLTGVHRHYVVN